MQNLCHFKRLLGECQQTKSTTALRLVKSGKEAILEIAPEINADILTPAVQKNMLVPASRLFGFESSGSHKFLLSGDRLNEQNSQFILSCLLTPSLPGFQSAEVYDAAAFSNFVTTPAMFPQHPH